MHTASKVVIGLGIVIILFGIISIFVGDSFEENVEEGIIFEGADGSVTIKETKSDTESMYYVHLVNAKYDGGSQGGYNERHYNSTWNLTEEDCNIVKAFSIKDNDNNEMFYPKCNYVEDSTDQDNYIVIGHLCNARNTYTDNEGAYQRWSGNGCPGGTFNFETNGNEIMVYDVDALIGAFFDAILKGLGAFGGCCCGSIILIIGIIMAATMEDNNTNPYSQQDTSYSSPSDDSTPKASSGWDEKEDYIRKEEIPEKSEIAIPDTEENKRSGEYKIPPSE